MVLKVNNKDQVYRERRIGKITSKRQLTIPKEYYDRLNLDDLVEIIIDGDELRLKKINKMEKTFNDYSDLVLKSILDEGISDKEEIVKQFRLRMNIMPVAVMEIIEDAIEVALSDHRTTDELDKEVFGEEL